MSVYDKLEEAGHDITVVTHMFAGVTTYVCEKCGALIQIASSLHDRVRLFHIPPSSQSSEAKCLPEVSLPDGYPTLKLKLEALEIPANTKEELREKLRAIGYRWQMYCITREAFVTLIALILDQASNNELGRLLHQLVMSVPGSEGSRGDVVSAKTDLDEAFVNRVIFGAEALLDGRVIGGTLQPVCGTCKKPFENIEHPMRPGVIMQRRCGCEIHVTTIPGGTITVMGKPGDQLKLFADMFYADTPKK